MTRGNGFQSLGEIINQENTPPQKRPEDKGPAQGDNLNQLERAQLRENHPEANPDCPVCHGLGMLVTPLKDNQTKAYPCDEPGCARDQMNAHRSSERFAQSVGIRRRKTFEGFEVAEGSREAYEAALQFTDLSGGFCWLLIYGDNGNGKTHLAIATVLRAIELGTNVRFYAVADMLAEIRRRIGQHDEEVNPVEMFVEDMKNCDMLVLDDFGAEPVTNWTTSKLQEILDYRYRNFLPVMVTTNLAPTELPARLYSRFCDPAISRLVFNRASDFRRR